MNARDMSYMQIYNQLVRLQAWQECDRILLGGRLLILTLISRRRILCSSLSRRGEVVGRFFIYRTRYYTRAMNIHINRIVENRVGLGVYYFRNAVFPHAARPRCRGSFLVRARYSRSWRRSRCYCSCGRVLRGRCVSRRLLDTHARGQSHRPCPPPVSSCTRAPLVASSPHRGKAGWCFQKQIREQEGVWTALIMEVLSGAIQSAALIS